MMFIYKIDKHVNPFLENWDEIYNVLEKMNLNNHLDEITKEIDSFITKLKKTFNFTKFSYAI